MHTVIVLLIAFALLAACVLIGQSGGRGHAGRKRGALVFLPLWFVGAALNLWMGVQHGYTVAEELPMFALVFGVPAAVASLIAWK